MFENNSQLPPVNSAHPPRNGFVGYSHSKKNTLDIMWDNPGQDYNNKARKIVGVNIYRSYDSELGEYVKLNEEPLRVGYYEDKMEHTTVVEDVSTQFRYRGNGPEGEWIFYTQHPIVKKGHQLIYGNQSSDVTLTIDGVTVPVARVVGEKCAVQLIKDPWMDKLTRNQYPPILPKDNSVIICTYLRNSNYVGLSRNQRMFYKLTTVTSDAGESHLNHSDVLSQHQTEAWDYIWKEAVRRNKMILQQGGEDCWLMIRKWFGVRCSCYSTVHQRGVVDCETCWGTGVEGGYEGPFPFLIAPFDGEYKLDSTEQGLHTRHTSTLWTNYPPRLNTFDLIFRKSGGIYVVGYVKPAEVRGNTFLQQEFNASLLSRDRVEHRIPFASAHDKMFITEKANIPDDQEVRGRTVTFENINY